MKDKDGKELEFRPVGHAGKCECPTCVENRARAREGEEPLPPMAAPGVPLLVVCQDGEVAFNLQRLNAITVRAFEAKQTPNDAAVGGWVPEFYVGDMRFLPWEVPFETEKEAKQAVNLLMHSCGLPPVFGVEDDDVADTTESPAG